MSYLAHWISVCIKEAKRIVGAGENGDANFGNIIVGTRSSLRSSQRALVIRVANIELVVVGCVGPQILGFYLWFCQRVCDVVSKMISYLYGVVDIRASKDFASVDYIAQFLIGSDLIFDAHWSFGDRNEFLVIMVEELDVARYCYVGSVVVACWADS